MNSLGLTDGTGVPLTPEENGEGSFREYIKAVLLASAQTALDRSIDVSDREWLTVEGGKAAGMGFFRYASRSRG